MAKPLSEKIESRIKHIMQDAMSPFEETTPRLINFTKSVAIRYAEKEILAIKDILTLRWSSLLDERDPSKNSAERRAWESAIHIVNDKLIKLQEDPQ